MKPRIAFFGTPELCLPILEKLKDSDLLPIIIVTNPDRPVGRKQIITPTAVKVWAIQNNIPVLQPEKLDDEFMAKFTSYEIDLSIVIAYGQIMPQSVIDLPTHGTLNLHYSLLPRHRGAAPVEAAILAGDTETGVTIQQMVFKLDAGPIIAQQTHPIRPDITGPELKTELNQIGAQLLVDTIGYLIAGELTPIEQNHSQANYFNKINKTDAEINLDENDQILWRKYRAYFGWPRIYYFDQNNRRTIITKADFVDEKFIIKKILPEGGNEQDFA